MICNCCDDYEDRDDEVKELREYAIVTMMDDVVIACEISSDTRLGIPFIKAVAPSDKCIQFEKYINPCSVKMIEYVDENMAFLVARMLNVGPVLVLEQKVEK